MQASYIKSLLRKQSKEEPVKLVAGLGENFQHVSSLRLYSKLFRNDYMHFHSKKCSFLAPNSFYVCETQTLKSCYKCTAHEESCFFYVTNMHIHIRS